MGRRGMSGSLFRRKDDKATVKAALDAEYTRNRTRVIEIWNICQVRGERTCDTSCAASLPCHPLVLPSLHMAARSRPPPISKAFVNHASGPP